MGGALSNYELLYQSQRAKTNKPTIYARACCYGSNRARFGGFWSLFVVVGSGQAARDLAARDLQTSSCSCASSYISQYGIE